jgi:hypothetical protein
VQIQCRTLPSHYTGYYLRHARKLRHLISGHQGTDRSHGALRSERVIAPLQRPLLLCTADTVDVLV